jgi:hypothetical protein
MRFPVAIAHRKRAAVYAPKEGSKRLAASAADLIGQVYNQRKNPNGVRKLPQNEEGGATCQAVADELGVGRATVERCGAYVAATCCLLPPAWARHWQTSGETRSAVVAS